MAERLTIDSVMTADGEVVPLGPVDKEGRRVSLDTTVLYGPLGEHYKVGSFVRFPLVGSWFMKCEFTKELIDVSSLYLESPDSWEKLEEDLERASGKITTECWYSGGNSKGCDFCRFGKPQGGCTRKMVDDILARIRNLRSDGE